MMPETRRGRILRDTNTGPGVVTVEGKQYSFTLDGIWTSDVPPRAGMVVDVVFNEEGTLLTLRAVPEGDLAREQAQQTFQGMRTQGTELAAKMKARFGTPLLVSTALLAVGWFFLNAVTLRGPHMDLTFYELLSFASDSTGLYAALNRNAMPGSGAFNMLAFVALVAPFTPFVWKDRRAALGGWLPLLLMMLAAWQIRSTLLSALDKAQGIFGRANSDVAVQQFWSNLGLSLSVGTYVSVAAALYLAFTGTRQFLVRRAEQA